MASLRDIRTRIASIRSTQQITRAMKMVAAAKLRRAQERIFAARPYAYKLRETIAHIRRRVDPASHDLFQPREEVRSALLIVVTSDRGLAGAFNTNLLRHVEEHIRTGPLGALREAGRLHVVAVGRKGHEYFAKRGYQMEGDFRGAFNDLRPSTAAAVVDLAVTGFSEGRWDVVEIASVALGDDHVRDAGRVRGERLLLEAADRQHASLQRDLARHADGVLHGSAGQQRGECGGHRDAGARPVLRDGACGHVQVERAAVERVRVDAQLVRVRAHPGEADARGLLHDVTQLSRQDKWVTARHRRRLDEQHVASGAGDREPRCYAGHSRALRGLAEEPLSSQRVAHDGLVDEERRFRLTGGDLRRDELVSLEGRPKRRRSFVAAGTVLYRLPSHVCR